MSGPRSPLFRDTDAGATLEIFFVSAILSILGIRGFLKLTGYPQIGGEGLHIAHMLWGGLGMLVGILLLLVFWNVSVRWLAAFVGGIGFGTFIDELGKFVTDDNDYFFEPTFALIYVLFILILLGFRVLSGRVPVTPAVQSFNERLRREQGILEGRRGSWLEGYVAARRWTAARYRLVVRKRWFRGFVFVAIVIMVAVDGMALASIYLGPSGADERIRIVQALSVLAAFLMVLFGAVRFPTSRLAAFRWFQRGLLVSILITRVFLFADDQLSALGGLAVDLALYAAVTFAIEEERMRSPRPV